MLIQSSQTIMIPCTVSLNVTMKKPFNEDVLEIVQDDPTASEYVLYALESPPSNIKKLPFSPERNNTVEKSMREVC